MIQSSVYKKYDNLEQCVRYLINLATNHTNFRLRLDDPLTQTSCCYLDELLLVKTNGCNDYLDDTSI